MASNVFPMLSSSPPPIDDCPDDDDDDDEFGTFTSANIPFDSSFDSPIAVDKLKQFKSGDNGVNDTKFSNEINKFNSFSNSDTPSPQEFVPDFPDENKPCENGLIPNKQTNSKFSVKSNIDISSIERCKNVDDTSHNFSHNALNFSNNSDHFLECHDLHQNSDKSSFLNNSKYKVRNFTEIDIECNSFEKDSVSVCDAIKENSGELSNNIDDETTHACDEPKAFISDSVANIQLSKSSEIDSDSFNNESSFCADKFTCDFNSRDFENSPNFDSEQCEKNLSSNDALFISECPVSKEECKLDCSEDIQKPSSHEQFNENFNNFSDNEFDEFRSCGEKVTYIQDSSGGTQDPSLHIKEISENFQHVSDNEFDDFQSCGEKATDAQDFIIEHEKSNEDFDDFQDFQYSNNSKEEDEFADFQDFSEATATNVDDFTDFSAVPFDSNKASQPSENSEFADFEEASFSGPSDSSLQASSSQKSVDTLSTVINAIFPPSDSCSESVSSDEASPQILEQSNKSRRLWEKLHEVEQTPGLRFQWGVSHSFQQLLRSVNVDYHSILRTSSVPIFASGLSLLEPVKGLSSSANHESEDRNQIPKDPIPPVEFDWNSSGLVNPLDSGQAVSTLMDLSFLSSVDTDTNNTTHNDHSFENEFLKPSLAPLCPDSSSKTQILEQLLSKNVSSLPNSQTTHRPSDLSKEAVRCLDQLPNLSFMQAKVLMFPISSKT